MLDQIRARVADRLTGGHWADVISADCNGCHKTVPVSEWDQDFFLCTGCVGELARQAREHVRAIESGKVAALKLTLTTDAGRRVRLVAA